VLAGCRRLRLSAPSSSRFNTLAAHRRTPAHRTPRGIPWSILNHDQQACPIGVLCGQKKLVTAQAEPVTDPLQRCGILTVTEAVFQGGVSNTEPPRIDFGIGRRVTAENWKAPTGGWRERQPASV
jgi:hypothetical protein